MDPTSSILTTLLQLTYSLSPVPVTISLNPGIFACPCVLLHFAGNRTVYKSSDRLFVPDFDQWCQIHSTFDSCLAGCNQTGLAMSPFHESFQPLDYICEEQNNFTDSDDYKCLQKYENDAIKNCLNDSEAMKNDADYLYGIRRADSDNATLIAFDKTCSSTSSAMICMSPIWDDKCGEDGEIILNNYFALTYYFVEQLKKALA
uniref:Uncharacterized protein n=1 Tax=Ditylenchus dipsaci TaxID=166011 RepID=A0A915CMK6_9BILA